MVVDQRELTSATSKYSVLIGCSAYLAKYYGLSNRYRSVDIAERFVLLIFIVAHHLKMHDLILQLCEWNSDFISKTLHQYHGIVTKQFFEIFQLPVWSQPKLLLVKGQRIFVILLFARFSFAFIHDLLDFEYFGAPKTDARPSPKYSKFYSFSLKA